jgi:hypothetical protein
MSDQPSQRPLPDSTQDTDIPATGGRYLKAIVPASALDCAATESVLKYSILCILLLLSTL